MTPQEKIVYLRNDADLLKRGFKRSDIAPPAFRLFWAMGIYEPPPIFQPFGVNATILAFLLFFFTWPFLWFLWYLKPPTPVANLFWFWFFFCWLTGLLMANAIYRKATRLRLPPWNRYPEARSQKTEGAEPEKPQIS